MVKSQEVSTWFVMAGGTLIIMVFSSQAASGLLTTLRGLIANSYDIHVDGPGFIGVLATLGRVVIVATALPLGLLALAALVGTLIQDPPVWSAEGLKPKFSKISPAAGLGRLVSKQALGNFIKGLTKLTLLGTVIGLLLWRERNRLEGLVTLDPATILPFTHVLVVKMLGTVVAIMAIVAAADYVSNTGNGSRGRKCRWPSSRRSTSRPMATPRSKARSGRSVRTACANARWRRCRPPRWSSPTRPTKRSRCATSAEWRRRSASPRVSISLR